MFFLRKNKKLTKKEIYLIPRSYDVVGDILIFSEFPTELKKKEKLVGEYILNQHPRIRTVTRKSKSYSGKFRTPKLKVLAGEKNKETIHKENGVRIKVNPEKAYYSPRSGTERLRIAKQVKKDENILTMFSGVAPFPLTLAKHTKAKNIVGVEINPEGHKYGKENIKLNKFNNIKLYKGDVKKVLPKLKTKFDRIIMPLPKTSEQFIKLAKSKLKKKGTIHLYTFVKKEDFTKIIKKYSKEFKVSLVKAGSPSPGKFRVCLDMKKL
jgi:tRNA (guanine37-N1)-methyltransferase